MNACRRGGMGAGKGTLGSSIVLGALALLLPALTASAAEGDEPQPQTQPAAPAGQAQAPSAQTGAADLVKKLGDSSWRAREDAQKELINIGEPAVGELEEALQTDDAEVRQRAESTLLTIRKNLAESASEAAARGRIWKSPVKEGVASAAAASGGVVCFLAFDGTLRAVDANTGKPKWTFEDLARDVKTENTNRIITGALTFPAPVIAHGLVYFSAQFGRLYAVDLASGEANWTSASAEGFAPPAVDGERVFAAGTEKDVRAFHAVTGKEIWVCEMEAGSTVRPAVSEGTVFVAARDNVLYAIDANSGQKKKLAEDLADVTAVLVTRGGDVLVRTANAVVCLGAADGKQRWAYPLADGGAAAGRAIVQMQFNNRLQVNNPNVANQRGPGAPVRQQGDDSLLAEDGVVYAAGGGQLHAIDAATGKSLWTYKPEGKEEGAAGGGGNVMVNVQVGGAVVMGGQGRIIMRGTGGPSLSLPALAGPTMYLASPLGLHAVDVKTRQELWRLTSDEPVAARPVVIGGVLYYGTSDPAGGGGLGVGGGVMIVNGQPGVLPGQKAAVAAPAPAGKPAGGAGSQPQVEETGPVFSAIRLKPAAAAK